MTSTIIAGDAAVLARRYASALYDLATEQKCLDAVATDLRTLKPLADSNTDFVDIVSNPRLKRPVLMAAMKRVTDAAKLNPLTGNFLGLLAQNRRLNLLSAMINNFLTTLADLRGEVTADVRTAHPLSHAQEEQLLARLSELGGGKIHLLVREDQSLIGGLVVKIGSRLIDASVKGKLERLERQLRSPLNTLQKGAA